MPCIDPNKPVSWNLQSTEFRTAAIGGSVFAASAIGLICYLALVSTSWCSGYVVSFSLLNTAILAGLVTFVIGLYNYDRQQRKELALLMDDMNNIKPVEVEPVVLETTEITTLEYIRNRREDLKPLFEAVLKLITALFTGYYKSQGKLLPERILNKLTASCQVIIDQIDAGLQQPQEFLRVVVGVAACAQIDEEQLYQLLKKSDGTVITQLHQKFKPYDPKFEAQSKLFRQILQVLTSQAKVSDGRLKRKVASLRSALSSMRFASLSKRKEKMLEYHQALAAMIDYLYLHAELSDAQIEIWTTHLVPPFLEKWKDELQNSISKLLQQCIRAYQPNGLFNDTAKKLAIKFGLGTLALRSIMHKQVRALPVSEGRKEKLKEACEALIPLILSPFYNATFETNHRYRKHVYAMVNSSNFSKLNIPNGEWSACCKAIIEHLNNIATVLSNPGTSFA